MLELILFWWILGCIAAAAIASRKGRSVLGFFFLAVLLSPLVGIIAALIVKPNTDAVEQAELRSGHSKRCSHCAEVIKVRARVCRYCGRDLPLEAFVSEASAPTSLAAIDSAELIRMWSTNDRTEHSDEEFEDMREELSNRGLDSIGQMPPVM